MLQYQCVDSRRSKGKGEDGEAGSIESTTNSEANLVPEYKHPTPQPGPSAPRKPSPAAPVYIVPQQPTSFIG